MTIMVGYAQDVITPDLRHPVYLAGFDCGRLAQSVHDDLFVRALAIRAGEKTIVLAAVDLIGLNRAFCLNLAQRLHRESTATRLVIAATHTHHGPDTIGLWGPGAMTSGVDHDYMQTQAEQILFTAREAIRSLHPAKVRMAIARVPGVARNARNPDVVDNELVCVQFAHYQDERPMVTLVNFPCHPETLWKDNAQITSDYPHYVRMWVERGTGAPCIFFSGALGGMMTPNVQEHTFEEAEELGKTLGKAALIALSARPALTIKRFTYHRQRYTIPLASPLLEQAIQAGLIQASLNAGRQVETETSLLRLGPAWLAFVPGELLPRLGLQMRLNMLQAGAETAGVIGLANDELGYILPDDEYHYPPDPTNPGENYEETMSIGPSAGSSLMKAFQTLMAGE